MKLSHKLVMVSAAVLMGVSPVLGMAENSVSVQAAPIAHAKGVHNTYGKNSRVKLTKTMKFVDRFGKKTSKPAPKGRHYTIWNVKTINGQTYYSIQTDLKYWIPAAATEGTVTYKSGNTTYTLKSNGKKVTTSKSVKKSAKKSAKKVAKTTKKTTKKAKKEVKKATKTNKKEATKTTKKAKKEVKKATKTTKKEAKKTTKKASNKVAKKSNSKKTIKPVKITMKRRAYVYDKNGKRVKNYEGTYYVGKGITVKGLGTKTIKGVKYYALQPNHYYVKASDVTVK